jgi:hypothetical protein
MYLLFTISNFIIFNNDRVAVSYCGLQRLVNSADQSYKSSAGKYVQEQKISATIFLLLACR